MHTRAEWRVYYTAAKLYNAVAAGKTSLYYTDLPRMLPNNVRNLWNAINPKTDDVCITLIDENSQPVGEDGCASFVKHAFCSFFTAE